MQSSNLALWKKIQILSSLSDDELVHMINRFTVKEFKKNEVIFYEEDTNEFMYAILSGKVKVFNSTEEGKETILAIHHTGDSFGEMSLIDGKTVPATVLALVDSEIGIMSKKDFHELLFTKKKVMGNLLMILCDRLRESWKKMGMLTFRDASQRVRMLLNSFSKEYGREGADGTVLEIKLTHQTIADMTGLTRETVTRVLDKLQEEGEITIQKNRFIKLNHSFTSYSRAAA